MTHKQGGTAGASLVTAGTVLFGTVLSGAGCASAGAPAQGPTCVPPPPSAGWTAS